MLNGDLVHHQNITLNDVDCKTLYSSQACLNGEEGSNTESFKETNTLPQYHDPEISSGMSSNRITDGIKPNFVKSWSVKRFIATLQPLSAAATGQLGLPILSLCLSSIQTNAQNSRNFKACSEK